MEMVIIAVVDDDIHKYKFINAFEAKEKWRVG